MKTKTPKVDIKINENEVLGMQEMQSMQNFLLYVSADGKVKVDVFVKDETIWLTQKRIAELFDVDVKTINEHLKNIYESIELDSEATIRKFQIVQKEGVRNVSREVLFYNLDAIIAVGYRVNSGRATQFRVWATGVLKEYIIKGFVMNDEKLKQGKTTFGKDYFEELLERIRDIRSSERRLYQKITDIYAQCSADYVLESEETKTFFATVQNKLHFAISGNTAAEIIYDRADSEKNNMGLTTWKNSPQGKIRKTDVIVAKNYLDEKEVSNLNRIVNMYLDYAEVQAEKGVVMNMKDWIEKLNTFLKFNEKDILTNAGKISNEVAEKLALEEYKKYKEKVYDLEESDFDKIVKESLSVDKK